MRILLASAPHADTFGYAMPPPGLLRLGGALLRRGLDVELEDLAHRLATGGLPPGDALCAAAADLLLARGEPDLLGLSTMGATLPAALAIARHVRARAPRVPIVLGGPGVGGVDAALVERFEAIDAVARGEAEATLVELCERVADGRDWAGVAGLTRRDAGGAVVREPDRPQLADLGELPDCAWSLVPPPEAYDAVHPGELLLVPIDSGRGCVYDCSFCSIGRYWSRRSRVLPAERLADEIEDVGRRAPGARAYLCHDLFAADRDHALALCAALRARDCRVPWEIRARVDHLDAALIEELGRSGCCRVLLGIESGDAAVLDRADKHVRSGADVLATVTRLADAGVTPILSFVLGLPGEDDAALDRSLKLATSCALARGVHVSLHLPNPQPGCGLGDDWGARSEPVEGIPPDMALGAGESAEERELIRAHPDLFSTFALVTALPGGVERLRRLAFLAAELPAVFERRARTWALLAHGSDRTPLRLADAWRASGAPFDAFVEASGQVLARAALAWERALEEAAQAPPPRSLQLEAVTDARVLVLERDAPAAATALQRGDDPDVLPPTTTRLAIVPGVRGPRTLRVSRDVATLLDAVRDRSHPARAQLATDAGRAALGALAERGLVRLPGSTPPTP